jgi:chemotaxis regulatin CheY-phosphate phosphatase CheZ
MRSDEQATCKRNEAEENEKKAKIEKLEGELKKGLREVCLEFNIITDKERKSMIASAMLRMNYSLKRTAEYTGLSLSEVKRLKEELQDL